MEVSKLIEKLESSMIDRGGMPLKGYEISENDGLNKAINIVMEHFEKLEIENNKKD